MEPIGFNALVPNAGWKHGTSHYYKLAGSMGRAEPVCLVLLHPPNTPHGVARKSAAVDRISGSRFALNMVAGRNQPEIELFGCLTEVHTDCYTEMEKAERPRWWVTASLRLVHIHSWAAGTP